MSVWKCESCGKVSNAERKPSHHWRVVGGSSGTTRCGPFAPAMVAPDGAVVIAPQQILTRHGEHPFRARQSTLRGITECPRREWHAIEAGEDSRRGNVGSAGDLGTIMHSVAEAILRTLHEHSTSTMPTQEAIEIAYEVYGNSPLTLPADEFDDLLMLTIRFVSKGTDETGKAIPRVWPVDKLLTTPSGELALEQRIDVPIVCQDGQTRILSCQPDAIFVVGRTLVIPDWKSGKGQPPRANEPQPDAPKDTLRGKRYLSDRGHFQGDTYSLAGMHEYPAAERVVFRELHLRSNQIREVIFDRDDLDEVRKQLAMHLMKLDRGLTESDSEWGRQYWAPKSGAQCTRKCPVARSCPIPAEQRGIGALVTDEDADREAARFVQIEGLRGELLGALQTRWNETGYAAKIPDGTELRWDGGKGKARRIVPCNGNGS